MSSWMEGGKVSRYCKNSVLYSGLCDGCRYHFRGDGGVSFSSSFFGYPAPIAFTIVVIMTSQSGSNLFYHNFIR